MKAVFAKLIYIGDDSVLPNAYVVFDGPRIADVVMSIPDCEIEGEYEVITPAFIDPHSHIGAGRAGEPDDEADINEEMDPLLFDVDVLDSIIMEDHSFKESVESGVLYSCVLPGSGNVIGGKSALIRNFSQNTRDAFMAHTGLKCAFGFNPKSTTEWKGTRASTRMGAVALLRRELKRCRMSESLIKRGKKDKDEIEPQHSYVCDLLERIQFLRIHAHKSDDIFAAIRLADEYNIDITIDHASDVHVQSTFDALKSRKIPLVYGPLDSYPYKSELRNESWRNLALVLASGVDFTLMSDHPVVLQRNLFLQSRFLRRLGISKAGCISRLTKSAADILRVGKDLGTLEKGKLASFVCWDKDPFDLEGHPASVYGEGRIVHKE